MEDNSRFLRQLSRFNADVRRYRETGDMVARRQITACEDAERELRAAFHARETAPGLTTVLNERIARAEAETQMGVLLALSGDNADFAKAWRDSETETLSVPGQIRWQKTVSLANRFFSVVRVQDNSYRFFTVSAIH